jgi:hypothetical protein
LRGLEEPDRQRVLSTVSAEVAQAAIAQVASCEACNPDADWPFEVILDRVMLFIGVHTDYFMPEPPACPRCKATVTEKTLVEWDGGVEIEASFSFCEPHLK